MRLLLKFPFLWVRRDSTRDNETRPLLPKGERDLGTAAVSASEDSQKVPDGKPYPADKGGRSSGFSETRRGLPPQTTFSLSSFVLKYLLFLSNLVLCVLGLVTLALGLWGLVDKESFAQERIGHIGTDPMLLFVCLGLALFLLCLSGCMGSLRENVCLLQAFSAGLLAVLSSQVLAAIVAYSLQGQIEGSLRTGMLTAMARYQDDLDLRFIMDEIQTGLQCCGADSYQDWEVNIYYNCSAPGARACGVPASCCVDPLENGTVGNSQCGFGARHLDEFSAHSVVFLGGCLGAVARWMERHSGAMWTVAIISLAVQVLVLFASGRLLEDIRRKKAAWQRGSA
ncbi:tetraspanin-10 isoform X2 [Brienomyrus brachyistius]|uniref:tetraspanin-10 isoform X2 n=1 Tax=Brienomyrus brachyistius TaxID=42636 RepID=UPI0020B369D6|nr:tetraspanin-10 isoform X2 [Brienomyrus brachyistius]